MADEQPTALMSVAAGAERLGTTENWYLVQLRAGKLPGHKIGRSWRLSDGDIEAAIEITARPATVPFRDPAGLTPRSRTHHDRTHGPHRRK